MKKISELTDIVFMLRSLANFDHDDVSIGIEAANEIERLRNEVSAKDAELAAVRAENASIQKVNEAIAENQQELAQWNTELKDENAALKEENAALMLSIGKLQQGVHDLAIENTAYEEQNARLREALQSIADNPIAFAGAAPFAKEALTNVGKPEEGK